MLSGSCPTPPRPCHSNRNNQQRRPVDRRRALPGLLARLAVPWRMALVLAVLFVAVELALRHGLQAWLQECLYVHEVEGFACRTIEFAVFDATPGAGGETVRLHAILRGEGIDAARHQIRPIRNVLTSELIATGGPSGPFQARATLEP